MVCNTLRRIAEQLPADKSGVLTIPGKFYRIGSTMSVFGDNTLSGTLILTVFVIVFITGTKTRPDRRPAR